MKTVPIGSFLTDAQIAHGMRLWDQHGRKGGSKFIAAVVEQITQPNIAEINRKLGQENDPKFLAYALEYALSSVEDRC